MLAVFAVIVPEAPPIVMLELERLPPLMVTVWPPPAGPAFGLSTTPRTPELARRVCAIGVVVAQGLLFVARNWM